MAQHPGFVQGGQPGYRPRKNNTNAVVAGAIAAVIIVGGIATTVVLASNSDPTTPLANSSGSRTAPPSGASAGNVSANPSDATDHGVQTPTISTPVYSSPAVGSTGLYSADSAGYEYFLDLSENEYDGTRALFCDPASFPLSESDVAQVETAYADGPSTGGQTTATMTGQVTLQDATRGTVTIYLDIQPDSTWCVDHMESQQN